MSVSTASVSSPKKRPNRPNPAKWDDDKTRCLLEVFEHEIDNGNRPSGVFSRQGWVNIVQNFNSRTGLNYNKEQLKNRQDNLRREFTKWEKLIGKETGLGWDYDKQTLSAPDEWWEERAKTDPAILKYRDHGPVHLDLLQKVFCGITATGFYSYIPEDSPDPLINPGDTLENLHESLENLANVGFDTPNVEAGGQDDGNNVQTPGSTNLRGPKRKRLSSGSRLSASDKFHSSMDSITSTIRESMERYNPNKGPDDDTLSYKEVLELLKNLPGMNGSNPLYIKAIRILTDKLNRIAFVHLLDDGIDGVMAWIEGFY